MSKPTFTYTAPYFVVFLLYHATCQEKEEADQAEPHPVGLSLLEQEEFIDSSLGTLTHGVHLESLDIRQ